MSRVKTFHSRLFWKIYISFSSLFLVAAIALSWVVFLRIQKAAKEIETTYVRDLIGTLLPVAFDSCKGGKNEKVLFEYTLSLLNPSTQVFLSNDIGSIIATTGPISFEISNDFSGLIHPEVFDEHMLNRRLLEHVDVFEQKAKNQLGSELLAVVQLKTVFGDTCSLWVMKASQNFQSGFRELWNTTGFVAVFGVVTALALGWSLVRKIMIPISDMVEVAEALRKGHYDRQVKFITNDDLGRLGDSLNNLGAEMRRKLAELQRLENVRRDFVANVSHEIKTPLTSIKGYVETLQSGAVDDPLVRQRFLEKIERNSTRLTTLVQDILSLAKIESLEDSFQLSPVDWASVMQSVVSRYEDAMSQKSLKLKVQFPSETHFVLGDREAMIQVLDNLVSNAIKYTPDGGKISLSLTVKGSFVRIDVEDTGIGIPEEHLDRIFERFYRVDKARSREMGGTGLGLSIVKHLVSGMGGEVQVSSALGIGSCFSVFLKKQSPVLSD